MSFLDKCKEFVKTYKHFFLQLYFVAYLLWFQLVERTVTTQFHIVHTPLDDIIPFCEYFIIPYFLWFPYIAWGILYFGFKEKPIYLKLCAFLFTGMTVFLLISTFYPNGHFLRPIYFTRHNMFTSLCEHLYTIDTPTNLFPSIHVYNSLGVHFAVMKSDCLKDKKIAKILSGALCASIILATMFLKQHSTFDVLTAFVLGYLMYLITFAKKWNICKEKATI